MYQPSKLKPHHNIIVLGGHTTALYLVRSFGPLGPRIAVIDKFGYGVARFSKHCTEFHKIQQFDRASLLKTVTDIESRFGPCAIFPASDETARLLSMARDEIADMHVLMIPDWSVTKKAFDKREAYSIAREVEISVPETHYPDSLDAVHELAQTCQFPVIIKPSTTVSFRALFRKKAIWARNKDELISVFSDISQHMPVDGISVQEFIPGPSTYFRDYQCCFHNGEPAFDCTVTRARQYPMDFGTATWATLDQHDRVLTLGRRLFANMGFWGMASAQFKYHQDRDEYYLLDVNPRAWKYIGIVQNLGVNLPLMAYQLQIGEEPDGSFEQPTEPCIWVDILSDLYVSPVMIAKGDLTIKDWLSSYRGKVVDSTFSKADPAPGAALLMTAPWLAVRGMI